jgi:hypothetical protein
LGKEVARLRVTRNDAVVLDMPLQTAEEVPAGTMTQQPHRLLRHQRHPALAAAEHLGLGHRLAGGEDLPYQGPLIAPVAAGKEVARLRVTRNDAVVLDMPLQTAEEVPAGTMTQRAMDAAVEVGGGWVRGAWSGMSSTTASLRVTRRRATSLPAATGAIRGPW